jgi:hypothetical protein
LNVWREKQEQDEDEEEWEEVVREDHEHMYCMEYDIQDIQ